MTVQSFADLIALRRDWIDGILKPWCQQASLAELKRAELEWADIAGKVDPQSTLWTWAWSRFPQLVHEPLPGVNETNEVRVTLKNGDTFLGYPNNRKTSGGRLVLLAMSPGKRHDFKEIGPLSIDEIATVERG